MVFVDSMSDMFHARVPLAFVQEAFAVMADTPRHTYQLLTTRSRRLRRVADQLEWPPNVWMGVSVEDEDHVGRVDDLRTVPAALRFVSAEPLLGPLFTETAGLDLTGISWVITGGESGPGARACDPQWVRQIRDACTDAGVAFFHKQWGGRTPKAGGRALDGRLHDAIPDPHPLVLPKDPVTEEGSVLVGGENQDGAGGDLGRGEPDVARCTSRR